MKREILFCLPSWAILLGALSFAQDSTSLQSTYPGDAVDPHDTAEQVNDYVVDLAAFQSSYGYTYGVAPLAKSSMDFQPTPWFFNAAMSAQAISSNTLLGVPFARNSYDYWNTPGAGINHDPSANSAGTPVDTSSLVGNQFGYVFSEYSANDPNAPSIDYGQIIGGAVNYEVTIPSRLYVSRVNAATNSADWLCDLSSFGVGGVDAGGRVSFRADEFSVTDCGGYLALTGDNWYRVDLLGRSSSVVNVIHELGADDAAATSHLLVTAGVDHGPPTIVPGAFAPGGIPILMGLNYSGELVYGASTLSATTLHWAGATGTRGNASYSKAQFPGIFGTTIGTGGALLVPGYNKMGIWGVSTTGLPVGATYLQLPALLVDNDDAWQSDALGAAGSLSFCNFYSSTFWRGGTGQVAVGKDVSGRLLAAATGFHPAYSSATDPNNLIAVARTADGTNVEWTVAAWTALNDGKAVYSAYGTTPIGKIVAQSSALTESGPSLSSPMIDSVGNVYFLARVELTGQEWREGLLRAVYDAASFSYRLELVMMEGDVFQGGNSGVAYQVNTLFVTGTSGSTPQTTYSGNINQDAYNGLDPSTLPAGTPKALGGLVVSANIVYDTSGDGLFERQVDVPTSTDQDYMVLLYVGNAEDCNGNGVPDDIDIADGTSTDVDLDGVPDECGAGVGYCFGDGTGTACPCGNDGNPGEGCANSTGNGAVLVGTGSNSVGADDLSFTLLQALPSQGALLFVANNQLSGLYFGDGLRCAGGSLKRLGVRMPNASGTAHWNPGMAASGGWMAGDTRNFQAWYRDPVGSPCANEFNTSNGVNITFAP